MKKILLQLRSMPASGTRVFTAITAPTKTFVQACYYTAPPLFNSLAAVTVGTGTQMPCH